MARKLKSEAEPAAAKVVPSAHDKAWEKHFVLPIARAMKARGVAYLLITLRDDGKAAFVLEPMEVSDPEMMP